MAVTRTSHISTVTVPMWRLSRPHSADSSQTPPSHAPCCRFMTWSVVDRTGGVRRWHLRGRQHAGAQRRRAPPAALHRLLAGEQRQYQGHAVACEPPPCWPSVTRYTFAPPSTLASWPFCLCVVLPGLHALDPLGASHRAGPGGDGPRRALTLGPCNRPAWAVAADNPCDCLYMPPTQ